MCIGFIQMDNGSYFAYITTSRPSSVTSKVSFPCVCPCLCPCPCPHCVCVCVCSKPHFTFSAACKISEKKWGPPQAQGGTLMAHCPHWIQGRCEDKTVRRENTQRNTAISYYPCSFSKLFAQLPWHGRWDSIIFPLPAIHSCDNWI